MFTVRLVPWRGADLRSEVTATGERIDVGTGFLQKYERLTPVDQPLPEGCAQSFRAYVFSQLRLNICLLVGQTFPLCSLL